MNRYDPTERIGVNETERIVTSELGWIFREQPIVDMGIDAHIELVEEGNPTGRLIAVQIKTGESHIRELAQGRTFYGDNIHLNYWTNHSLPVILVVHLPNSGETLWAHVSEETIERTPRAWKILFSSEDILSAESRIDILPLFSGTPMEQKLRRLAVDEPLMRHIQAGKRVSLGLEDWMHKSLGRSTVEVFVYNNEGEEVLAREWFQMYTGYDTAMLAEALFPWATFDVDEEFYNENCSLDFDEPSFSGEEEIYPYEELAGEVQKYRLRFQLNEIACAYLTLSEYVRDE